MNEQQFEKLFFCELKHVATVHKNAESDFKMEQKT